VTSLRGVDLGENCFDEYLMKTIVDVVSIFIKWDWP